MEPRKTVYSQDVVFREVKDVPKSEFLPRQEEPKKIEFELDDAKYESTKEDESEKEPHTQVLRIPMRERRKP